ncbi:rab11 family-interacting protein 4B isoform X5 [Hermetia illucens]|uniref:rab11 family-interacting protein 4B isoform X5 n=1 Tax=Hermetia illucens TaxID=343691 RepID=UPI0018CBF9C7|nr:rab11 family-interacting protein 4B isoform X5 [Hermetia illucens]
MMAPMPSSKSPSKGPTFLFSAADSDDSSPAPSSPPSTDAPKSQCSSLSEVESFEGFGENDATDSGCSNNIRVNLRNVNSAGSEASGSNRDAENDGRVRGVELELAPHANSTPNGNPDNLPNRRWGSMRHSGRRQLGSNALASHLYRSSSFNSSGRSSTCDTAEDMYSDMSLEDVQDLSHKLDLLQRQVTDLADTRNTVEDRTTRTKTEYAVLQARYHMLEEQFRESELRAEERLAEEQKRHRELLARVEREAALQNENCQIKIRTIEMEANSLREEAQRLRVLCDKQANDLHATEEKLEITRDNLASVQQELLEAQSAERKLLDEKKVSEDLMLELGKELERLRSERGPALPTTSAETLRLEELHQELDELRQKNKILEEQNEELQAAVLSRGVEEGRHLLNGTLNSLAQELEEMSQAQDSVDSATLASLSQLQQAYQDKEEENQRLKHYIDTILLNIVENYPQLLEVKPSKPVQNEKISH